MKILKEKDLVTDGAVVFRVKEVKVEYVMECVAAAKDADHDAWKVGVAYPIPHSDVSGAIVEVNTKALLALYGESKVTPKKKESVDD